MVRSNTKSVKNMKKINHLVLLELFLLCPISVSAQETDSLLSHEVEQRVVSNPLPKSFFHTGENKISDPAQSLYPFWKKLRALDEPLRLVHIGDSHVRGHIFPVVTRSLLEEDFGSEAVFPDEVTNNSTGLARETGEPGIVYHIFGINGATSETFSTEERVARIAKLKPDLIIISFGTNEAHDRLYQHDTHRKHLLHLLSLLKEACPDAVFLLTTPPGAYYKSSRKTIINPRTETVVNTIKECAQEQNIAVWDLYSIVGGRTDACHNWRRSQMLRQDGVHFTPDGYTLQGKLLHQALVKAYNEYVANRLE